MAKANPIKYCQNCCHRRMTLCSLFFEQIQNRTIQLCKLRGYREIGMCFAHSSKSIGSWATWLEKR